MSSGPFKSIKTYSITNDMTGITLTGSGLATPFGGSNGILVIDNQTKSVHANSSNLNPVLFEKSCVIKTNGTSGTSIKVSVGLFND